MKKVKTMISALVLALTINAAAPAPQAQAGIIFAPFLIGIVMLVIGIENNDALLIVLDADGNLSQNALEQNLAKKYSFIDDREVIATLASTIRTRGMTAPLIDGKKTVTLARQEVLDILAPTGLAVLEADKVEAMIKDLQ